MIALALVSGSWIAVDSSGLGVLRATLKDYPVDFVANPLSQTSLGDMSEATTGRIVDVIESVKDVTGATPYVSMYQWTMMNSAENKTYMDPYGGYYGAAVFLSKNTSRFFDAFGIRGDMPDRGTVAISGYMADMLDLAVGENILLTYSYDTGYYNETLSQWVPNVVYVNLTYPVSKIWTQDPAVQSSDYYAYYHIAKPEEYVRLRDSQNPVVFNLADLPLMFSQIPVGYISIPSLSYYIWIDRDAVIKLGDLAGTVDDLQFIQRQLNKKGYVSGFTVGESDLTYPLTSLAPSLEGLKFLFLALSAPVIGLGTYLSVVGVDLGVTGRRRETGILKSRGASYRQVFLSLVIEAVALGAVAGVLGLIIGFGLSRPLMDVSTSFSSDPESNSLWTDIAVSQSTIIMSILLGIGLMLLSTYRPFKRISKADVAETLHYYSPIVSQVEYKARTDIILLAVSIWSIASILIGFDYVDQVHLSWIAQVVLAVMLLIGTLIFPIMPFFLSLSIVRLLTRGSRRLYTKFTILVKPWTKDLHYLVDKNIVRNPKRASNLCVIISLALAFGLFISVTMESSMAYERDRIKFGIGSDVKIDAGYREYGTEAEFDLTKLNDLNSIPGVKHIAFFDVVSAYIDMYGNSQYSNIYLFNHSAYAQTVNPDDFYFVEGGSEKLEELVMNGSALLDVGWRDNFDILEGDTIRAHIYWSYYENNTWIWIESYFPLLVVGFVKSLPGFNQGMGIYMDRASVSFFTEEELTRANFGVGAFIDVDKGVDQTLVARDAVDVYESANLSASYRTLDEEMTNLKQDPTYGALSAFLYIEYILSATIMTVGVGLLIFVAVADREKELACIMARGSSGGQIRKILMGESMTLMVVGLVVGASVGILTAYLFNTLSTSGMYGEVERRMVFTWVSGGIVLASIAALLLASIVATTRAGKIKLAEVLRIRGG